jgi:hypothetical protein
MLDGLRFTLRLNPKSIAMNVKTHHHFFSLIPSTVIFIVGWQVFQNEPFHPSAHLLSFIGGYGNDDLL